LENNYNWFGVYAFYKGLFPKNAYAMYDLKVDHRSFGDSNLLIKEAQWDMN